MGDKLKKEHFPDHQLNKLQQNVDEVLRSKDRRITELEEQLALALLRIEALEVFHP